MNIILKNVEYMTEKPEINANAMESGKDKIDLEKIKDLCNAIKIEIGNSIVGYDYIVDDLMVCLIAKGHILLEGVPGMAKTTMAKLIANTIGLKFKRIQFTQDLLPADITGHYFFNQKTNDFELRKGPLFSEIILGDEVNRSPPRTQSALLEAMEERQVTIEGNTFKLPEPFIVIATLNPIETEGVYSLPEAQIDRFMYKIKLSYLSKDEELQMLYRKNHAIKPIKPLVDIEFMRKLIGSYNGVYVEKSILEYLRDIIVETRDRKEIVLGASPRAGEHMLYASKAHALVHGRDYVIPDDIKVVAPKILNHRLILSVDAELDGITSEKIIDDILDKIEVPKGQGKIKDDISS